MSSPADPTPAQPTTAVCILTGKSFPTSLMIQTEHGWVSAEARDRYFQSLREGVPVVRADQSTAPPGYQLYTVGQITLAAFLGSPLAGFWLTARNLRALGRQRELAKCWWIGIGLTAINVTFAFFASERFPTVAISVPFVVMTRWLAHHWLAADLAQHRIRGGRRRSWWAPVGFGVLSAVIVLAVGVITVILFSIVEPIWH